MTRQKKLRQLHMLSCVTLPGEHRLVMLCCMMLIADMCFLTMCIKLAKLTSVLKLSCHCSDLLSLVQDETASDDERLRKCQFFHKVHLRCPP